MSLRYRKSVKLAPGVKLNIGKRGLSTTIGPRGFTFNFNKRGSYVNAGIPGTGISTRTKLGESSAEQVHSETVTAKPHINHRTALLFFVSLIVVGIIRNSPLLTAFWIGWFGYWLFLGLRRIVRKGKPAAAQV